MESQPIPIRRRVFLVGFMGAGKTTVGRKLAGRLGWTFTDLDETIEATRNRTISEIFAAEGEQTFRRYERESLQDLLDATTDRPAVLALGGGTIAQPGNKGLLSSASGITVWLYCPLDELRRRCGDVTNRPLFQDAAQFQQLYENRLPYYEAADFRVDSSPRDPAAVVEEIVQCLPY